MIYFSGKIEPSWAGKHPMLGFVKTWRGAGNRLPAGHPWIADNGCFNHPDAFDPVAYARWLAGFSPDELSGLVFATLPDVRGDGEATLRRSAGVLPFLRATGLPLALVLQDGMEWHGRAIDWNALDAAFVGGSDAWRMRAGRFTPAVRGLVQRAIGHGLWVHVGRVNSWERFEESLALGADSVDGNYAGYGPENVETVCRWLDMNRPAARPMQSALELGA